MKKAKFGFMYRGNGFGWWDIKTAFKKAVAYAEKDNNYTTPTIWIGVDNKPYKTLMTYMREHNRFFLPATQQEVMDYLKAWVA